ncbi:hypothetical protein [Streptomyces sp. NPDC047071]|uniref:hypothetical protein n=1 Tax=Streptomyces sp. NPDC047071 TaxID=3154808 RepID=UPI003453A2FE
MRIFRRRCSWCAGAVVAPVLLGVVACGAGSGGEGERAGEGKGRDASQGVKAERADGQAQTGGDRRAALKEMALAAEDVGGRRIRPMNNALAAAFGKGGSIADPARCRPLDDMLSYGSSPEPKAFHPLSVVEKGSTYNEPKGTKLVVGLAAHDGSGAKKVLAKLRAAVTKCGNGFEGGNGAYNEVQEQSAEGLGDESVSYVVWGGAHGEDAGAMFTVVRSGSTVVTFNATDLEAPWEVTKPDRALVKAQLAKVAKAAH